MIVYINLITPHAMMTCFLYCTYIYMIRTYISERILDVYARLGVSTVLRTSNSYVRKVLSLIRLGCMIKIENYFV
jgi:hypothetical protein